MFNLEKFINAAYKIAVAQFVIFLLLFLGGSFGSTYLKVEENEWISKFEKYIVLSVSLFMVVPFAYSTILFYGLLNKHTYILKIWIFSTLGSTTLIFLLLLGPGIFFALKGTAPVAYTLIVISIILEGSMLYCLWLVYQIYDVLPTWKKMQKKSQDGVQELDNSNRSSQNENEDKNENYQEENEA